MSNEQPILDLRNIHKAFPGVKALSAVNFRLLPGEVHAVMGQNGAGKSTLLKILSRVTGPTSGSLKIRGRIASLLEVGTGFHPELTGRENVFLNGAILGMKRREIQNQFDKIVEFAGVEQFVDTPVKRYSSGMYVRLAFAVATHLNSEILIVDEVLAVGDSAFQEKCVAKMRDLSVIDGKTVLFVSHNVATIKRLCNVGLVLDKGNLAFEGEISQAIYRYLGNVSDQVTNQSLAWVNKTEATFDSLVRVERIFIAGTTGILTDKTLRNSERYTVQIDLVVSKDEPNLVFFLTLYSASGEVVFVSDLQHSAETARKIRTKGKHTLIVDFPQNLLLSKVYLVEVSCLIHFTGWVLPPGEDQRLEISYYNDDLRFDLDYNDINHPFTYGPQPGEVAPHLTWSLLHD